MAGTNPNNFFLKPNGLDSEPIEQNGSNLLSSKSKSRNKAMAGTNPNNVSLIPNGLDSEFMIRQIAATSSAPFPVGAQRYNEQPYPIHPEPLEEQGRVFPSGGHDLSEASGENTMNFVHRPSISTTAMNAGERYHYPYGNEYEQYDVDMARFNNRQQEPMIPNAYGMDEASFNPITSPGNRPQDRSAKCQPCLKSHRFCDQAKPKCNSCVKESRICVPQADQPSFTSYQHPNLTCDRCLLFELECDQAWPRCGNCQQWMHTCLYENEIHSTKSDLRGA